MTLANALHEEFGKFTIALETTVCSLARLNKCGLANPSTKHTENVYRLTKYPSYSTFIPLPSDPTITLTAHDPAYALPSCILLEAHAAIARILHITGMGQLIDKIMEDRASIGCFAPDGTTNVTSLMLVP